jgi:hypothetical protein
MFTHNQFSRLSTGTPSWIAAGNCDFYCARFVLSTFCNLSFLFFFRKLTVSVMQCWRIFWRQCSFGWFPFRKVSYLWFCFLGYVCIYEIRMLFGSPFLVFLDIAIPNCSLRILAYKFCKVFNRATNFFHLQVQVEPVFHCFL